MSSRIFQGVIVQMKEATDRCIGVVDEQGFVIASSELATIGSKLEDFSAAVVDAQESLFTTQERTFKILAGSAARFEYAVFVEGTDNISRGICILAAIGMNEASTNFEEKHNKAAFVKNIISDNILPGDVYVRAKELHFTTDVPRAVLLIRQLNNTDIAVLEHVQNLFPDRQHDFVLSVSESDIVVIKELTTEDASEQMCALGQELVKSIRDTLHIETVVGIGTTARHLRELADRYKEAQVAIDVGKIFEHDLPVIHYENLGIGRIIYQLPVTLCEMFLSEAFKRNPIEALDEDTLDTINRFFENNLNVSETARKLYVHRNTLVYRLEKVKKITGLDLREFEDAILFKVAVMVKQYLNSQNGNKF